MIGLLGRVVIPELLKKRNTQQATMPLPSSDMPAPHTDWMRPTAESWTPPQLYTGQEGMQQFDMGPMPNLMDSAPSQSQMLEATAQNAPEFQGVDYGALGNWGQQMLASSQTQMNTPGLAMDRPNVMRGQQGMGQLSNSELGMMTGRGGLSRMPRGMGIMMDPTRRR